jgi:hypothetical protein
MAELAGRLDDSSTVGGIGGELHEQRISSKGISGGVERMAGSS